MDYMRMITVHRKRAHSCRRSWTGMKRYLGPIGVSESGREARCGGCSRSWMEFDDVQALLESGAARPSQ